MKTLITKFGDNKIFDYINSNQVIAFPTETVYGIGANGLDKDAVEKIYIAKGRKSETGPAKGYCSTQEHCTNYDETCWLMHAEGRIV